MSIKRNLWKVGIVIAGTVLLLLFMIWLSVPAADAQGGSSWSATPGTVKVQATPTEDATVTALNKEKLMQEVQQLQQSNNRGFGNWLWSYAAVILSSFLSTLVVVIGALIGFWHWRINRNDTSTKESTDRQVAQEKELEDRKAEREKRAEEQFQSAIEGLSSERERAKIGAAILLRTFLRPGYEQFYTQTFDLTVANLRLRGVAQNTPEPLGTLSQALITAFRESFPLARDKLQKENSEYNPQSLEASYIQLDNANLNLADLEKVWMPGAFLREANLFEANLDEANLANSNLNGANLIEAKLNKVSLFGAYLIKANLLKAGLIGTTLYGANLSNAILSNANLNKATLREANLEEANLGRANLSQADFGEADLSKAILLGADLTESSLNWSNLSNANLSYTNLSKVFLTDANLSGADLSNARFLDTATSLERADLRGVKGLTKEQLKAYQAKGAIIDDDPAPIPSQSTITPPHPGHDNITQAQSTSPAQGSESSATSSEPSSGSQ